jgi:DNA polymerase-3 subunit delta'
MNVVFPWQQSVQQAWQQHLTRLGHGYLLVGMPGLGIHALARDFARGLLCQADGGFACGVCSACQQFDQQSHPDYFELAVLDGKKEVGVDQVRELTQKLMQTAHQGGYKIALIKQAENLNTSAFNALLKTLEEPPLNTVLLLTSYQPNRLPATVRSRCQQLSVTPPSFEQALAWLQQQTASEFEETLLKRALKLNWGAPLAAKAWLENQAWQQDQEWQQAMQSLNSGQMSISQAVQAWLKWPEPEKVFDLFYFMSVTQIRRASYQQQPLNSAWFAFQNALLQAKQDWQNNANKELLLEALAWQAIQVMQGQNPTSAFDSGWIRGNWI